MIEFRLEIKEKNNIYRSTIAFNQSSILLTLSSYSFFTLNDRISPTALIIKIG